MKDWTKEPAFLQMDKRKQDMVKLLTDTLEGKKLTEALPYLMEWKKQMEKENICFTPEENKMLTSIFSEQMTPAQKKQFQYLKHFISS